MPFLATPQLSKIRTIFFFLMIYLLWPAQCSEESSPGGLQKNKSSLKNQLYSEFDEYRHKVGRIGKMDIIQISPRVFHFSEKKQMAPGKANPKGKEQKKDKRKVIASINKTHAQEWKKYIQLKDLSLSSEEAQSQKQYYEDKYNLSQYDEQPFCIVIPSYKNIAKDRYLKNIRSILQQDYSNYRIVFIDDGSDDGTGAAMQQYAKKHQISESKLTIMINDQQKGSLSNQRWAALNFCKPYQIFMIIDGDDELLGKQVFKLFNAIYQRDDLWILYSNFITERGTIGYSRPYSKAIRNKTSFRKAGFCISHLRSLYTKLFTLIKDEDLQDKDGNWYRAANDVALYIPALEMAGQRSEYLPELAYLYNPNTGLNNHRIRLKVQKANDRAVRAKKKYDVVEDLFTEEQKQQLQESLNQVIPIKDPSLPNDTSDLEGWEK